jgi:hypothetical protein
MALKMHEEMESLIDEGLRYTTRKKSSFTSDSIRERIIEVMTASVRPKHKPNGGKRVLAYRSFMLSDPLCSPTSDHRPAIKDVLFLNRSSRPQCLTRYDA